MSDSEDDCVTFGTALEPLDEGLFLRLFPLVYVSFRSKVNPFK